MRVALCQLPVSPSPEVNLDRVATALREAASQRAELAVFPEATQIRFGEDLRAAAEPIDSGAFCAKLSKLAADNHVALVAGVFEPEDQRVFNTAVVYDATGRLLTAYRKIHLYDALGVRESREVAPGDTPVTCEIAGTTVGVEICYDIRFPELSRALAVAGARLITVSAAWASGLFKEEHWVTLLRARAIENTVWIAAAGQVPDLDAPPAKAPTGVGRSMLIDPMGVVRADLGPSPAVVVTDADMTLVDTVRATLPSLANRRDDVFGKPVTL